MMSGTFKGFSDIDIKKMKQNNTGDDSDVKEKKSRSKSLGFTRDNHIATDNCEPIDDKARLSIVTNESSNNEEICETKNEVPLKTSLEENEANNNVNLTREDSFDSDSLSNIVDNILKFEKPINIEEFQSQQKLIEEQNRMRKEMLSKALEDREKQTAEETVRLEKIKKELQTLDVQLSGDVCILRKQIDKSSLAYAEAEKNYHKVELEFLAAKVNLQKQKERKEMLTEHLCTLIAHNEARKAKKLESLMDQLAYKSETSHATCVSDGVCEQTGKMLEMEDGEVILRDDHL